MRQSASEFKTRHGSGLSRRCLFDCGFLTLLFGLCPLVAWAGGLLLALWVGYGFASQNHHQAKLIANPYGLRQNPVCSSALC